jgi:hypothetical protein
VSISSYGVRPSSSLRRRLISSNVSGRRDAIESRVDVVEPSTSVRSDDIMRASTITSSARPSALVMPVLRRPTRGGQDATR